MVSDRFLPQNAPKMYPHNILYSALFQSTLNGALNNQICFYCPWLFSLTPQVIKSGQKIQLEIWAKTAKKPCTIVQGFFGAHYGDVFILQKYFSKLTPWPKTMEETYLRWFPTVSWPKMPPKCNLCIYYILHYFKVFKMRFKIIRSVFTALGCFH